MKARDLISILSLNPEAEILTIHTQYDGSGDISTLEQTQVITDLDAFVIVADNYYDKRAAVAYMSSYNVSRHAIDEKAKSVDPLIYVD